MWRRFAVPSDGELSSLSGENSGGAATRVAPLLMSLFERHVGNSHRPGDFLNCIVLLFCWLRKRL